MLAEEVDDVIDTLECFAAFLLETDVPNLTQAECGRLAAEAEEVGEAAEVGEAEAAEALRPTARPWRLSGRSRRHCLRLHSPPGPG